jgi:membrane protein YqaA with SNARE-associated domain
MIRKTIGRYRNASPRFEAFIQSKPVMFSLSLLGWPRRMIRRLYAWVVGWAQTRQAEKALAGIAFAESSFFPIPPDPLLIAMTTVKPKGFLRFAAICTAASVLGGMIGYLIGVTLFETVGRWVIDTYHLERQFQVIGQRYGENAFFTVFTAAFTPIPYKLITIAAGVFKVNILSFLVASIIGRGARFFLVSTLMHHFGKRYKDRIEKYIDVLSLAFVLLIVAGFVLLRYL